MSGCLKEEEERLRSTLLNLLQSYFVQACASIMSTEVFSNMM